MKFESHSLRKNEDTTDVVHCPACNKEMLKMFIPELNFNIDLCVDGCGGIFFDNTEFEKIKVPNIDISGILEHIKDKEYPKTDQRAVRICGHCNSKMLKMGAGGNKIIEIDVCPNCGGKFLDNGELESIRESYIGVYEKSIIEYALRNQKSFSVICSEVIKNIS